MSTLPLSITHGASLAVIAAEVSRASAVTPLHYVERRADRYRWSPAHRGGPYPLLRTVAKLLDIDYHSLVLPFSGIPKDGLCIVGATDQPTAPDAWTVLDLGQPATPAEIQARLKSALNN